MTGHFLKKIYCVLVLFDYLRRISHIKSFAVVAHLWFPCVTHGCRMLRWFVLSVCVPPPFPSVAQQLSLVVLLCMSLKPKLFYFSARPLFSTSVSKL